MKKFTLNLWSNEEKKKQAQAVAAGKAESAVIDGVDGQQGGGGGGRFFGIKSYLHHFYLASPTSGNPFVDDVEVPTAVGQGSGTTWYLLPPPPAQRMGLYICRLLTVIGLLLLLAGATGIIVGYCWPTARHWSSGTIETSLMRIAIDQDEEGNFYIPPERFTEFLRDPMHQWKIAGFCVFAMGASLMALGLLVPTFAQCLGGGRGRLAAFASEDNTPNEPPIRIYPAAGSKFRVIPAPSKITGGHKISPTSGPVPVMEEISKVQPGSKKATPSSSPSADDLLGFGGKHSDVQPLLNR
ncbi:neurensin domain-containing protein [Ditylenchus destructor]|uniref:Neurensin domain-containing protein n=1 Tax=Ditylenchus destructor TaxID=166010 RepID=A0AAD4RAH1_9BILA|nr:neurensin domain-containing protein [Ditylenchus destructor]